MISSGIDIGSLTGKAVILDDNDIIASEIIRVKRNPVLTSTLVYKAVLEKAGLKKNDINFCVGTGYGREKIPFINKSISEISCHGKGAFKLDETIRTIIDIGGQDCKIIQIDDKGDLLDFRMNDKCAAGTGRYLELMAEILGLTLDELGTKSLSSHSPIVINSTCSIYAQSEVLHYISKKAKIKDITAGINRAMAERVVLMAKKIKATLEPSFVLSGGVAKNKGVVQELQRILGMKFQSINIDPQLVGALGAAFIGQENLE